MTDEPWQLGITDLLSAFAAGRLTPSDAVMACLDRLGTEGMRLNAVLVLAGAEAMTAAAEATRRWRTGTARPLEGVPFAVKDILYTKDLPTTGGSTLLGRLESPVDAEVVARLRAAGGILVAKLQTLAFAIGDPVNQEYGATLNPADTRYLAGGSSSGSAAAVAAFCVPLAIGTDSGGSIRMPAAYCGVSGLKPTFGRVSRHGVMPLSWTLDHVGPLTRSAADLRLALAVMSGEDPRDPATGPRSAFTSVRRSPTTLSRLRLGIPANYFLDTCSHECLDAFASAVRTLRTLGATVVPVSIPQIELAEPVGRTIILAESASLHEPYDGRNEDYDDRVGANLLAGRFLSAKDYLRCLRLRHLIQQGFAAGMADVDAFVTPTSPTWAPDLDTLTVTSQGVQTPWLDIATRNTYPFNVTGMPAVSVPIIGSEMPIGLQIAAQPFRDDLVIDVAEAFELAPGARAA